MANGAGVGGGAAQGMPVPMGVIAETGQTHPELPDAAFDRIRLDPPAARVKSELIDQGFSLDATIDDANDLSQTGWAVLFASDADPAIREALQPLIELRRSQVGSDRLFKIFDGANGVRPGQSAASWTDSRGVSLTAPVRPRQGVPFYLLIIGPPTRVPFEFQAQMDLQWAVGRLHFDSVADYASYAQKVVEYESGHAPAQKRQLTVWMPRNPLDLATPLLAGTVMPEFLGQTDDGVEALGAVQRFGLQTFVGEGQATKANLAAILDGTATGGSPAILFTGSHGAEWSIDAPDVQRTRQGALVTQEWMRGQPLTAASVFSAADLGDSTRVHGMMAFLFACFGGGCPAKDSYFFTPAGEPVALAPEPLVAAFPQALLRRGALAAIAHVDRAFSYAFESVTGTPQAQLLRAPLELLLRGRRVGLAADPLNMQWSVLAAQLGMMLGNAPGAPVPRSPLVANLFIARDDARNYVVLGDPATRLRVEAMN